MGKVSKEIDLIKCIISEIDDNLYSDFGGNPCISYTPNLKKLLLALDTPEVRHFFENCNNQAQQLANLEAKLAEYKSKTRVAFSQLASFQLRYDDLKKEYKEQEDLLEKTLAINSKLQLELDQLKQQLEEYKFKEDIGTASCGSYDVQPVCLRQR